MGRKSSTGVLVVLKHNWSSSKSRKITLMWHTELKYLSKVIILSSSYNTSEKKNHCVWTHVLDLPAWNQIVRSLANLGRSKIFTNLVPRLSLLCLPQSLEQRPRLRLVTWPSIHPKPQGGWVLKYIWSRGKPCYSTLSADFSTTQLLGGHVTSRNQGLCSNDKGRQRTEILGTRLNIYPRSQLFRYSHWGNPLGFKDKHSHALVVSCVLCFTQVLYKLAWLSLSLLNVRQSQARRLSLLPAAMTFVACLASYRSFSPPGSLLPITYPCLGRLGVRAPSGNLVLFLPSINSMNRQEIFFLGGGGGGLPSWDALGIF